MSNYLKTKSFHHLLVISKIFLFFIIIFISFFYNAFSSELDNLFLRLKQSENHMIARNYESKIWKLWLNNGTSDASNTQMQKGVDLLNNGKLDQALTIFIDISKKDPKWAESYNKIATIKFLKGDYLGSINDIKKTLKLEPRHFGAISGLVQINIILKKLLQLALIVLIRSRMNILNLGENMMLFIIPNYYQH